MNPTKYQEINAAREILQLPETATMTEIKAGYRRLLTEWHPDKGGKDPEKCAEMTRRIISAYETLLDYCRHYRYAFSEEAVKRHQSPEEWWFERFGNDPLWGNGSKQN